MFSSFNLSTFLNSFINNAQKPKRGPQFSPTASGNHKGIPNSSNSKTVLIFLPKTCVLLSVYVRIAVCAHMAVHAREYEVNG